LCTSKIRPAKEGSVVVDERIKNKQKVLKRERKISQTTEHTLVGGETRDKGPKF
jgi:hypothetical protein